MATSVDMTTYPSARDDANEDNYSRWGSDLIPNGVVWGVGNELAVFGDSTGMHVKVPTGRCSVEAFRGEFTSQQQLDIGAADGTNPRIDVVVARLDRTSPATVKMRVTPGTPAATPTAPTLTNDSTITDLLIATVRVNAGVSTVAAGDVTLQRLMVGQKGFSAASPPSITAASGSEFTIAGLTTVGAWIWQIKGSTIHIEASGIIGFGGSPGDDGGVLFSLPYPATYANVPVRVNMNNEMARGWTGSSTGSAPFDKIVVYPALASQNWPIDGVGRGWSLEADFRIDPR